MIRNDKALRRERQVSPGVTNNRPEGCTSGRPGLAGIALALSLGAAALLGFQGCQSGSVDPLGVSSLSSLGSVRGLTFNSSGQTLGGVKVQVAGRVITSLSDGSFTANSIEPGLYVVEAVSAPLGVTTEVRVYENQESSVNLVLKTGGISGRVVSSATGLPLAGARVLLSTGREMTTGPDGVFAFAVTKGSPATISITVTMEGYQSLTSGGITATEGSASVSLSMIPK